MLMDPHSFPMIIAKMNTQKHGIVHMKLASLAHAVVLRKNALFELSDVAKFFLTNHEVSRKLVG